MKTPHATGLNVSSDRSRFKQLEGNCLNYTQSLDDIRRVENDIIDLSEGSQKAINLARANELGAKLPDAVTNPAGFSSALKQGYEDIKRITRLFSDLLTLLRMRR